MQNNSDDNPKAAKGEKTNSQSTSWAQSLFQIGLGDSLLHTVTNIFSILAIIIVIWMAEVYFNQPRAQAQASSTPLQGPTPIAASITNPASIIDLSSMGIVREADIHTNIPSRPRQDIITYVVQKGDTISGIADTYGLQPMTIFAANYAILQDDPENLKAGENLKILPVDGLIWPYYPAGPFSSWAKAFGVTPEDILNYPLNHLNASTIGDPTNPNIKAGTYLIVPGGQYQFHTSPLMGFGTRTNPPTAQVAGPGACPPIPAGTGAVGLGTFIYPTDRHYLSGFDYSTVTHHLGIDLAANLGDNIYAADAGVIVYAGWNNYGYGNMVMIDHGTGFQTLYAHLSQIFVQCGQSVVQGQTIAAAGATGNASGPHLHFEVRTTTTVIDPWNVLPPASAPPWKSSP